MPVFVEHFSDVSYARFATRGSVTVEIEVDSRIRNHTVFPVERVASTSVIDNVLQVEIPSPDSVVVWIDGLEKLFLLPDPMEVDAPAPGSPGVFNPVDHGADPTGRALATSAIQAAIDQAGALGRAGTVVIPPGWFRAGTLTLRSNVTLYLAPGALLQGSSDPDDYPIDPGRQESAGDSSLPPEARYLGRTMTFSRFLLVDDATNVRITGRGTIDGEGTFLRTQRNAAPNLLRVRESRRVVVEDVLFRDAAAWSLHVLASGDVAFRNVKVINDRSNLNTDGIDPDMSSAVTVDRSFVYTKDDAVCVKATGNSDLTGNPSGIVVTNCLVSSVDAALKVGTESAATTFSDILFEDNFIFDSGRAMSVVVCDGATYDRIAFRRIRVGPNVDHLVEQVIGVRDPGPEPGAIRELGALRELSFEDISAPSFRKPRSNWTWYVQFRRGRATDQGSKVAVFEGADELHAVDGLRLRQVIVNGRHLRDRETARRVANLTIGPHVRDVTFE